ncbi:MAG: response regulator [Spirochaetales bacterium]|nr:response regulator [Spirochaetales bacterium]
MANVKLFIVEDENIVALDIQKRLEKLGYLVAGIAATGEEAVKRVVELRPELVLMDIKLAGEMDGIEAAEKILESYSVPIVYITAFTEEVTLKRAKITEPFGYILKPFEERELRINVEIALYRHQMQNVLKEREQLFQTTLESIDDAVITTDAEMRVQLMNPAGEAFTGWRFHDARGRLLYDILTIEDRETGRRVELFREAASKEKPLYRVTAKNREERVVQASTIPLSNRAGGRVGNVIVLHDFTAREKADRALRLSEERYREFFENNLAGDFISSSKGVILTCNTSFAAILGFDKPEEVMQYNLEVFFPDYTRDDSFLKLLGREKRLQSISLEFVDRNQRPLFLTANVIPEFDGRGKLDEIKWYIIDKTENRKIQEQLLQSQKMEGIGRLAGGIAHDFNNLLGAIIGYADLLLDSLPENDPIRNDLEAIRKAGRKAAALTRQLLAFSRRQVLQPKVIDLNTLVADLEKMLKRLLPENIKLLSVPEEALWKVKVDPIQIEQVLINLALNARDAMSEGGKLTIASTNIAVPKDGSKDHFGIPRGSYVLVKVSDTGIGFSEEMKQRIFEPFFTTKAPGEGTGLGLSTAYGIIKQSEGYIFLESELNKGATFFIYLPRCEAEISQTEDVAPVVHTKGDESILLVEDEEVFREMVNKALEKYGYNVLNAGNPGEALLICEQYANPIHLLITDVVMPHLSGIKLAERLLKIRPEMKVLYISGYFNNASAKNPEFGQDTYFLQKPFSPSELEQKVRKILDVD